MVRKLFRRVLPIMLSVAMTLQSVPMTALAAEIPAEEETVEVENPVSDEEVEGDESDTPDINVEEEEELADAESAEQVEEPAVAETPVIEEVSEEPETDSVALDDGVNAVAEVAAVERTARIVVDKDAVDEYAKGQYENPDDVSSIYTLDYSAYSAGSLSFYTTYLEDEHNKYNEFMEELKKWFSIEVGGAKFPNIESQLDYSWAEIGDNGAETPVDLPTDAGKYVLIISMPTDWTQGSPSICDKLGDPFKVYLEIKQADIALTLGVDLKVEAGTTAKELIEAINENYTLNYKEEEFSGFDISRDIIDAENKDLDITITVYGDGVKEDGTQLTMAPTDRFDRTKEYQLTIAPVALKTTNYQLSIDNPYKINVGDLKKTAVLFERQNPDLRTIYVKDKKWTVEEVTTDAELGLFTEDGAPDVYVEDEDGNSVLLKGVLQLPEGENVELTPGWYTLIHVDESDVRNRDNDYKLDEDAGEIEYEEYNFDNDPNRYIYRPMAEGELPTDAGEYYIIYTYAGDGSAYDKSYSEPIKFTIDPVSVVVALDQASIAKITGAAGAEEEAVSELFSDDMDKKDVRKALAQLTYGVYPLVVDETTSTVTASTESVFTPGFFGTYYRGDAKDETAQYFVPEFVLQRRVAALTIKGETVAVDEKTVDWQETDELKLVADYKADDHNEILPQDLTNQDKANLESITFEYRVYFTGNKVVYGNIDNERQYKAATVSITDVTTSAANRNYLADITSEMLENTAVPFKVAQMKEATIDTDAIVQEFIKNYPQQTEGDQAESGETDTVLPGTLSDPATKIYDKFTLFGETGNRASYKKAKVNEPELDADGNFVKDADGNVVVKNAVVTSGTDESLTYTWDYITFAKYEEYFETWEDVQQDYVDFDAYLGSWIWTRGTDPTDGSLAFSKDAGIYRLTVAYTDPNHEYKSVEAEVFFRVEPQEIIIEPATKYAKYGNNITFWKENRITPGIGDKVIGEDFTIYKLPDNNEEKLTEENKAANVIPTDEVIAEYVAVNGREGLTLGRLTWEVVRKAKNPADGTNEDEWVELESGHTLFDDDFDYGVVAHWNGNLGVFDGNNGDNNYTTRYEKTFLETGETKHHEIVTEIDFYTEQLYVEVDAAKIRELGKEYDGKPVDLNKVADALTFYTDAELTKKLDLPKEDILNIDPIRVDESGVELGVEYDPAKVNVIWTKNGNSYTNRNAVYGGTYTLSLSFDGGLLGTSGDEASAQDDETADTVLGYAPSIAVSYKDIDDTDASFTITPRDVTIEPVLIEGLTAGETADKILADELQEVKESEESEGRILEEDWPFFTYVQNVSGNFDVTYLGLDADGNVISGPSANVAEYSVNKFGGYPAFKQDTLNSGGRAADYLIQVDGAEIKDPAGEYLRYGSEYTVKLRNRLASPLAESYNVTFKTNSVTINNRGTAEVTATDNSELSASGIGYDFDDYNGNFTVKTRGAVKFYYEQDKDGVVKVIGRDDEGEAKTELTNTNILGFRIKVPKEYWNANDTRRDNFVYKSAVWNAGGYFCESADVQELKVKGNKSEYYIDVVFPLTKEDLINPPSFSISWEDDYDEEDKYDPYVETFTLSKDIVMQEDLTKAVAPKSIAFTGVTAKMAVGEQQQLNLKITKAQLGDVIRIRYRISGGETKNEFISLDPETGVVTALKAGTAATTIEAYPVYKDAKGDVQEITGGKVKKAKTKIKVADVTAPAVKKVVAQGTSAKVYFTVPDNGYRREIYVIEQTQENKKWKADKFNDVIDGIKNGDWESAGLAIAPEYSYVTSENAKKSTADKYDQKLKALIYEISGLDAEKNYIVYVRNVSAARELDDGSVVTLSAKGGLKKFKTIKPQVKDIELDFTVQDGSVSWDNALYNYIEEGSGAYTVDLSAKKAQLNVYGLFPDLSDAAEENDQLKYPLVPTPKEKTYKKTVKNALKSYQTPKLEYVVLDQISNRPFDPDLEKSKYAAINKKGVISLKGTGLDGTTRVYIYVRDNSQVSAENPYALGRAGDRIQLTITAKPASVTGKKAKMTVGQTIQLSDYLQYKDAKKKNIANYISGKVTITAAEIARAKEAGFEIEDSKDPNTHSWSITAKDTCKNFKLEVTDIVYEASGAAVEKKATVTLTAAQITPVKGLKVTYVDDQNITIKFTHAANIDADDTGNVYDYALEVRDARGNVVDKIILPEVKPRTRIDVNGVSAKELNKAQSWIQYRRTRVNDDKTISVVENESGVLNYYTGTKVKNKTFVYTYTNKKLVRLSSYTLTVTPLSENKAATKSMKVKTKTKDIPASRANLDLTGAGDDLLGGGNIVAITSSGLQKTADNVDAQGVAVNESRYRFITGNTYTLRFDLQDVPGDDLKPDVARDRVTDKLAWKSSNTKVATIKANAGNYTATFKPVNQGSTTISVTSGVTKKVIARWTVNVYAVKDGSSFGGGYEPTWDDGFYEKILALYDPSYDGRLEVLSMGVPLVIDYDSNVTTWVSFTAPHYGEYSFFRPKNIDNYRFYDSTDGKQIVGRDAPEGNGCVLLLEENQKVYFKVTAKDGNTIELSVTGTELARLTEANKKAGGVALEVKDDSYVAFTAWEDNVYTFWHNGAPLPLSAADYNVVGDINDGKGIAIGMKAGETIYIYVADAGKMYVEYRDLTSTEETTVTKPGTVTLTADNQVQYMTFKVGAGGVYTFTYPAEGVAVNFSTADGSALTDELDTEGEAVAEGKESKKFLLEEGTVVVIEIKADPVITDSTKSIEVSVEVKLAETPAKITNDTAKIDKNTTKIVEYTLPVFVTNREKFKFAVTGDEGTQILAFYDQDYKTIASLEGEMTVGDKYDDAETVEVKANTALVDWDEDVQDAYILRLNKDAGITTIYIKVAATEDKDAELKVEHVAAAVLAEGDKTETITSFDEKFYTFTAKADDYYEFGLTVEALDKEVTEKMHTDAELKIFNGENPTVVNGNGSTKILFMKAGQTYLVNLDPPVVVDSADALLTYEVKDEGADADNADGDDTELEEKFELVRSKATVSVKTLGMKLLKLDAESDTVKIDAKDTKTAYYFYFTAPAVADYTLAWNPKDPEKDNAKVEYATGAEAITGDVEWYTLGDEDEDSPLTSKLAVGTVVYIKVTLGRADYDYGVEGTLKVTADNMNVDAITVGNPYDFELNAEKGFTKTVKFTAPEEGNYVIVTAVDNSAAGLPYGYPTIYVDGIGNITNSSGSKRYTKGQTRNITLTYNGNDEANETKGTITILLDTEEVVGDQDLTVKENISNTYTFTIPESGRYEFKADYDTNEAWVYWDGETDNPSGNYYRKNAKVNVRVYGRVDGAKVKLEAPKKIEPKTLVVGGAGNKIENLEVGEAEYYELIVTDPKTYEFGLELTDSVSASAVYYIDNAVTSTGPLSDGGVLSLSKNSKLFIKVTSGSTTKAASCVLTATERKELAYGENKEFVSLNAGDSVKLVYRAYETGYYRITATSKEGAELVLYNENNGVQQIGESVYDITELKATGSDKRTCLYTLTNNGNSTATIAVTVEKIAQTADVAVDGSGELKIAAGESGIFTLKTYKEADYIIKITDGGECADLTASLDYVNGSTVVTDQKSNVDDGILIEQKLTGETLLTVTNGSLVDKTVKVTLSKSEVDPLAVGEKPVEVKKDVTKYVSFIAAADGRYVISRDDVDGVTMTLISEQKVSTGNTTAKDENVVGFKEYVLDAGDKLVFKLTYTSTDEKPDDSKTVNVKIQNVNDTLTKITGVDKAANEPVKAPDVTIPEKGINSVWYQFEANIDAVYTFVLEDEDENDVTEDSAIKFYQYITDEESNDTEVEDRYMKEGQKVYINVTGLAEGKYTLKYTAVEAMKDTGADVLDAFEYPNEVREVKWHVTKGGIYEIAATAIRGNFTVIAKVGTKNVLEKGELDTTGDKESETCFLKTDDIVTFTVTADVGNEPNSKSYVALSIYEINPANELQLGKNPGTGDPTKAIYYERRIKENEEGLYEITVDGDAEVYYFKEFEDSGEKLQDTLYKEFFKNDRIVFKVNQGAEKDYTLNFKKVDTIPSLDGEKTKVDDPYSLSSGDTYFGFTTKNAYAEYQADKKGKYYIAVQCITPWEDDFYNLVSVNVGDETYNYEDLPQIIELAEKGVVKFTFTNTGESIDTDDSDSENPVDIYKELKFKVTVSMIPEEGVDAEHAIELTAGTEYTGTLLATQDIYYQFKVDKETDAGIYVVNFVGSNSYLMLDKPDGSHVDYNDLTREVTLANGDTLKLEVSNASNRTGSIYTLTVSKVEIEQLTVGTASKLTKLSKDETAYLEFESKDDPATDNGATKYQIYYSYSASADEKSVKCEVSGELTDEVKAEIARGGYYVGSLAKGKKLTLKVTNNSGKNVGFSLIVKKVEYAAVDSKEHELDAYEQAYYEYTSNAEPAEGEDGTKYQISLDSKSGLTLDENDIKVARLKEGSTTELEDFVDVKEYEPGDSDNSIIVSLAKGEKVRITVSNTGASAQFGKKAAYTLTVAEYDEPDENEGMTVINETLTLGKTVTRSITSKEKVVYEMTVAEAGKYNIYFQRTGNTKCVYEKASLVEKDGAEVMGDWFTEGTWEQATDTASPTYKRGDKIRFTVSGAGSYNLKVSKMETTKLTLGSNGVATTSKILSAGESAVYEFTASDDPLAGEETTRYQIYGSFSGYTIHTQALEITEDEDGKAVESELKYTYSANDEFDLKNGQVLRITVTGNGGTSKFTLNIAKVTEYKPMTLGTAVSGRIDLAATGYEYYEFKPNLKEEDGYVTYQIFGTATYNYTKVTKEGDKFTENGWSNYSPVNLAKDQYIRIRVTGQSNQKDGYNLAVASTKAEDIAVNATKTVSLGMNQNLYYELEYKAEKPAEYYVDFEATDGVYVYVNVNDSYNWVSGKQSSKFDVKQNDKISIWVNASKEVDSFTFTLKEFSAEPLKLDTQTESMSITSGETAYYQYTHTAEEESTYVISAVESSIRALSFNYKVSHDGSPVKSGSIGAERVGEVTLNKNDVLDIEVSTGYERAAAAIYTYKLWLQKKPAEPTALNTDGKEGTLSSGKVEYFKVEVPSTETKGYLVSVTCTKGTLYWKDNLSEDDEDNGWNSLGIDGDNDSSWTMEAGKTLNLALVNTSMYNEAEYSIEVQKNVYETLQNGGTYTIKKGDGPVYYEYDVRMNLQGAKNCKLSYTGDVKVRYTTDGTAKKEFDSTVDTSKEANIKGNKKLYLEISYAGTEDTCEYSVTIKPNEAQKPDEDFTE